MNYPDSVIDSLFLYFLPYLVNSVVLLFPLRRNFWKAIRDSLNALSLTVGLCLHRTSFIKRQGDKAVHVPRPSLPCDTEALVLVKVGYLSLLRKLIEVGALLLVLFLFSQLSIQTGHIFFKYFSIFLSFKTEIKAYYQKKKNRHCISNAMWPSAFK